MMNNTYEFLDFLIHTPLDQRSAVDLQRLSDVVSRTLQLQDIDASDLNILSSESYVYNIDKSVILLQGECASAHFIVLRGTVRLFYETDVLIEQENFEKFGNCRDKLEAIMDEINLLGTCIKDLKVGDCFGEYALLAEETLHNNVRVQPVSSINSPRSSPRSPRGRVGVLGQKCLPTPTAASRVVGQPYSAIGLEEDTLLLIVPADTYRRTLQKRHIAQREVVRRALALWNMPLFRQVSFAKVFNLAHSIEIQKYIYKHVLAEYTHEIQSVYLIIKGEVKVAAPLPSALSPGKQAAAPLPSTLSDQQAIAAGLPLDLPIDSLYESTTSGLISLRVPIPSVDVLQPGQVVGEVEVSKGLTAFRFHYTIQSLHTEVVVMPLHLYIECMREYMLDCKDLMHINVTVLSEEERALRLEFRQSRLREIKLLSSLLSGKNASIAGSSVGSSIDREGSFVNSVSVDVGHNGSCSRWSQFSTPQKQQQTQQRSISSSVMHYHGSAQSARYYPAAQPSSSRPSPIKRAPGRQRKHTCTATTNTGTSSGIGVHKQQPVQQQTPKTDSSLIQEDNSDDELKNDATSTVNSGPNACMEYAATFEEAAARVQEALQNIRERVRARKENPH